MQPDLDGWLGRQKCGWVLDIFRRQKQIDLVRHWLCEIRERGIKSDSWVFALGSFSYGKECGKNKFERNDKRFCFRFIRVEVRCMTRYFCVWNSSQHLHSHTCAFAHVSINPYSTLSLHSCLGVLQMILQVFVWLLPSSEGLPDVCLDVRLCTLFIHLFASIFPI